MAATNDTNNGSVPDLDAPTILAALDVSELAYGTYGPNGTAIDLYGDGLDDHLIDLLDSGWTQIVGLSTQSTAAHHYQGMAFYKVVNGVTEVIIANRGTQSDSNATGVSKLYDYLVSDAQLAVGMKPAADGDAYTYYQSVVGWLRNPANRITGPINIIETGHSLGGQEADYVEVQATTTPGLAPIHTEAVTFDAPGLPFGTPVAGQSYNALNISASTDFVHVGGGTVNSGYAGSSVTIQVGEPIAPWEILTAIGLLGGAPLIAIGALGKFAYDGLYANHVLGNVWAYQEQHPALGGVNVQTYAPSLVNQSIVTALQGVKDYDSLTDAARLKLYNDIFKNGGTATTAPLAAPQETYTGTGSGNGTTLTGSKGDQLTTSASDGALTVNDGVGEKYQLSMSADGKAVTGDSWSTRTGLKGTDTFGADGSSKGKMVYADGGYATYFDDGQGNTTTNYYSKSGVLISAAWTHTDGSSGTDFVAQNGLTENSGNQPAFRIPATTSEIDVNPDGSYLTLTSNPQNVRTQTNFASSGAQVSQTSGPGGAQNYDATYNTVTVLQGSGGRTISQYSDDQGFLTYDSWTASDGSHGSDTFNMSGAIEGKTINVDGTVDTYSLYQSDTSGTLISFTLSAGTSLSVHGPTDLTRDHFDKNGSLAGDQWQLADGAHGTDSFNPDGSGSGTITDVDGTSSVLTLTAQGNITIDNPADASGSGSRDWWHADGTHGITTYGTDGSQTRYTYAVNGTVLIDDYAVDGTLTSEVRKAAGAIFNPGGSNFTRIVNSDRSSTVYYSNSNGDVQIFQYDSNGQLLATDHSSARSAESNFSTGVVNNGVVLSSPYNDSTATFTATDGKQYTQYFNNTGKITGDDWISSGGHGTDVYFADGSKQGASYSTDGSGFTYADSGTGNVTNTQFAANGRVTGDAWKMADGSHGSDSFGVNGTAAGIVYGADGSYSDYSNDGIGDTTVASYTSIGTLISDAWSKADKSKGSDLYSADGTSVGGVTNADGSNSSYANNGHGTVTTNNYDASGNGTGSILEVTNSTGVVTSTSYSQLNAAGAVLGTTIAYRPAGWNSSWFLNLDTVSGTGFESSFSETSYSFLNSNDYSIQKIVNDYSSNGSSLGSQVLIKSIYGTSLTLSFTGLDGTGEVSSDSWVNTDGVSGTDTWTQNDGVHVDFWSTERKNNSDGGYSIFYGWTYNWLKSDNFNAQGTYSSFTAFGYGVTEYGHVVNVANEYTLEGVKTNDTWTSVSDGAHGSDVFNADGSSGGSSTDSNGKVATTAKDKFGDTSSWFYSSTGLLLSDAWSEADGSTGTDTYNSDGSIAGSTASGGTKTLHAGGDYTIVSTAHDGTVTTNEFSSAGLLLSSEWTHSDGAQGGYVLNVIDGSYTVHSDDGHGTTSIKTYSAMMFANPAVWAPTNASVTFLLSNEWTNADGTHGNYVLNPDGSSTNTTFNTDGSHSSSTGDGSGNVTTNHYSVSGALVEADWTKGNGTYGSTVWSSDGGATVTTVFNSSYFTVNTYSASGVLTSEMWQWTNGSRKNTYNADGSKTVAWVNDGTVTTDYLSATGELTQEIWSQPDGSHGIRTYGFGNCLSGSTTTDASGNVTTSTYDVFGNPKSDTWVNADGSHGSDTTYAGGMSSGIVIQSDGSYEIKSTDFDGGTSTKNYTNAGLLLSDTWTENDGSNGAETFNADGSVASKVSSGGTKEVNSDGSYAITSTDADGNVAINNFSSTGTLLNDRYSGADGTSYTDVYTYDSSGSIHDEFIQSDGTHGSSTYNLDGSYSYRGYSAAGALLSDAFGNADGSSSSHTYAGDGSVSSSTVSLWVHGGSVELGNEDSTVTASDVSGTVNTIHLGDGTNQVNVGSGNDEITVGNGSNTVATGDGNDNVTLGSGSNQITLGNGSDTIFTVGGSDIVNLGTGQYTLANTGAVENIVLTADAEDQLWFSQVGNNLQINVLGGSEQITVADWFTTGTKLNQLTSSDGHTINAAGIDQLVQAMASFGVPPPGQTSYTPKEQTALAPTLAASWH